MSAREFAHKVRDVEATNDASSTRDDHPGLELLNDDEDDDQNNDDESHDENRLAAAGSSCNILG